MVKVELSIIIVHYKVKKVLFDCIKSIYGAQTKIPYEIIVVDNDEVKVIDEELKKFFPKVKYVKALKNNGFGAGNNLGERYAKGEFLFFLSPDTKIFPRTLEELVYILQRDKKAAVVSPILLDKNRKPYPLQGTKELTPSRGIVALSFLNKLFPNNPISKDYWLSGWNKKSVVEVDVAPGTAIFMRKDVFEKIGGFDERFFLYFEESDLCRRVKNLGYKIYIIPHSRVFHIWGASTKNIKTSDIFSRSRFLYFRKHFGFFAAVAIHIATNINLANILLTFVLILAAFLRFFRLSDLMMFIGDQGWYYLSARDMVLTGNIPLVGITSSHTWLHQGALWIYMLSPVLWLFNFNPVGGAYLSSSLGVITVFLVYKIVSEVFSRKIGLIATFLYTTSPLIVIHSRMAYHTSPIPLFTIILFYSVYKWIKGNILYFPFIIFLLAILYNFELATFTLVPIIIILLIIGFATKKQWAKDLINKKIVVLSFLGFLIPMIPMIIYDFGHGFPQTLKFIVWIGYKIAVTLQIYPLLHPPTENMGTMLSFITTLIRRLLYLPNTMVALTMIIIGVIYLCIHIFVYIRKKKNQVPIILLQQFFIIPALGYMSARTNSEGYVLIFFPVVTFMIALLFNIIISRRLLFVPGVILLFGIGFVNSYSLVSKNYLMKSGYGIPMIDRINIAKQIVKESGGKEYNIIGKGEGSQYESFTMGYEYLTWWIGKQPSKKKTKLQFIVREAQEKVTLTKIIFK